MNIIDLILSNPEQANSVVVDSLQSRVFDYLDNYQLEEEFIDEDTLHPAGTALLKHINPIHHSVYKPFLTKKVFTGSYKDRSDVLNAAKTAGHLAEESIDEGTLHPAGTALLKHINPKHHSVYKPFLTKKVFTGSYKDRSDVLNAAKTAGHLAEESLDEEQLDEISKATLGSYIKKANDDTSEEKFSQRNKGVASAVKKLDKDGKEDLLGKAMYSKLAKDKGEYTATAGKGMFHRSVDKLTKEDLDAMDQEEFDALVENFEQLDELSKATLGSYLDKAKQSFKTNAQNMVKPGPEGDAAYNKIWRGTLRKGINRATDRLAKEDLDEASAPWAANTKKAMMASKKAQLTRSPADHAKAAALHKEAASDPWHPDREFHLEQATKHEKSAK